MVSRAPAAARELTEQLTRHVGPLGVLGGAGVLLGRGLVALAEGDTDEALGLLTKSRAAFDEIGAPWGLGPPPRGAGPTPSGASRCWSQRA